MYTYIGVYGHVICVCIHVNTFLQTHTRTPFFSREPADHYCHYFLFMGHDFSIIYGKRLCKEKTWVSTSVLLTAEDRTWTLTVPRAHALRPPLANVLIPFWGPSFCLHFHMYCEWMKSAKKYRNMAVLFMLSLIDDKIPLVTCVPFIIFFFFLLYRNALNHHRLNACEMLAIPSE